MSKSVGFVKRLWAFWEQLHTCARRDTEALFELTGAILTVGAVSSPAHLSLQTAHRHG